MNEPLILTFDIGTQSMRAMIVSKKGELIAFEQISYDEPYISLHPGWAEQKPSFYYEKLTEISLLTKKKHAKLYKDIIAVTLTSIRDTVLCLDKEKKPLRDIILWLDKRETDHAVKKTPFWLNIALKIVKMKDIIVMQQRMTPCNWIMEHESEIWQKTDKYVLLPTYLNYLLTGNLKDSVANMIGHIPMDYKNRKWEKGFGIMKYVADIHPDKLIDICEPGETIGNITEACSKTTGIPVGLPLIATGSDKSSETLGLSVIQSHQAAISFGTTATIQTYTDKYFTPAPFVPSYPAVVKDYYNAEVQVYRGYWMLSWFKKEFAKEECIEAKKLGIAVESMFCKSLPDIAPGCDGLMLQPYWGPGVVTPNAKGAIIGFSDVHTRMHIYKAIIEGIGFALLDGMYTLEKRSKRKITELFVGGGGSQSDEICQITANMTGLPVYKMQTHEACGIGSSMVAFVALNEFKSYEDAVKSMCHIKKVFEPNKDEYDIYQKLFNEIYVHLYKKLEPLYKRIKNILRHYEM